MHPQVLKHRSVIHYKEFLPSLRQVAARYNVSKSTLARWVNQGLEIKPNVRKPRSKVHNSICQALETIVQQNPFNSADKLIKAVCDQTGIQVSRSTMYRSLASLGKTYKRAMRCRTHDAIPSSHPFLSDGSYDGDVVSVDESSFYVNDYPSRGWGQRGTRVRKARPTTRKRVSLLLAVGREGVVSHQILTGSVNTARFTDFVRTLPNNRPVILDNYVIHKGVLVRDLCATKNIALRYTPPYCPWYNPVEFCFSEIKAAYRPLRLAGGDFVADVRTCVQNLRHSDAYFRHAMAAWEKDRTVTTA